MVDKTTGKNADRKIRKIGEASPTPNHRIAKGIHAKGDRLRKKLTMGEKCRSGQFFLSHPQAGWYACHHGQAKSASHPEQRGDEIGK